MASNMQGPGGRPSKLVVLYLDLPTYGLSAPKHFIFIDRTTREVFERQGWAIIILNKPFVNDYYVSYKGRSTPKEDRRRGIFANPRQRPIGSLARSQNGCRSRNDFFSEVAVAPGLSLLVILPLLRAHLIVGYPLFIFLFLYLFVPKASIPSCTYI